MTELAAYFDRPRPKLVAIWARWSPGGVVVDFGCGAGWLGRELLAQGLATEVIGIEQKADAVRVAADRLTSALQADVGDVSVWDSLPERVDGLLFADVLEHLRDPDSTLAAAVEHLRPGGRVLISVPNVRHIRVVARLVLRNRWDYHDEGVCDEDHVRFFTSVTLRELLLRHGLVVERVYPQVDGRRRFLARHLPVAASFLSPAYVAVATKPA
jgi:2-polyprenyl-3-methyl-5-hydroxy-6-metoxy-1,4-benzoquinol methylase